MISSSSIALYLQKIRSKIPITAQPPEGESLPLHLELYSLEQLTRHAKSLAERHEVGFGRGHDRLLARLGDNEVQLVRTYEQLSLAVQAKRPISPAGEWLLDNFHLIEEQIRTARRHLPKGYSRELPHLVKGPSAGYPRVYSIALEIIAHVDGRVDRENTTTFVAAYQEITPLKLGEFWAIPIMLRLALIENLRRVAVRVLQGMIDRQEASRWADVMMHAAETNPKSLIICAAEMAKANPELSNSFVAELVRRLQGQGHALDIPLNWIEHQLTSLGRTTAQTVQMEGQQQAANQVSVGASIGSLRFLGAIDWREFVESMSAVEHELRQDPAGVYGAMDFITRDRYRHAIERIAKTSDVSEWTVARQATRLTRENAGASSGTDERQGHVGYYLIDQGLPLLERAVSLKTSFPGSLIQGLLKGEKVRLNLYVGTVALVSGLLTYQVLRQSVPLIDFKLYPWLLFCVTFLSASQVGVAFANWLATSLVRPDFVPKMDFSKGIPASQKTLVVVPSLLVTRKNVQDLLDALEVRYLANRDANLHFALLTDFVDADSEVKSTDEALCQLARQGIESFIQRYQTEGTFFLFHRNRKWNEREKIWMGYERKRGKLEALNDLLRRPSEQTAPRDEHAFDLIVGDLTKLAGTRYVITLDADTTLPREAAQKLIGTMAHPLNRPRIDKVRGRVIEGYGIMQPRVATSLPGSERSWFARLLGSETGIDPYTNAVSDVYQDLFKEGSFIGKGIYDVDAVRATLSRALPENLILSHDLLEGCIARSGLISDVVLYESQPSHYGEDMKRRHRWIRGDWQICQWLLPKAPGFGATYRKNALSTLSKWKIFDNLRRSLVPFATTCLLLDAWLNEREGLQMTFAVLFMVFVPHILVALTTTFRKPEEQTLKAHFWSVGDALVREAVRAVLALAFLPYEALVNLDAVLRSVFRMVFRRRRILEWRAATDPTHGGSATSLGNFYRSMVEVPVLALVLLGVIAFFLPMTSLQSAAPLLGLWFVAPSLAYWLSRPIPPERVALERSDEEYMRRIARKTWRFFETFGGAEDNWLPPDNFQEYPDPVVAHRTSPTNIGLSLLANLSAYDFGYLSAMQLLERTTRTFATLDKLDRFRGHFYNWYDTQSLKPLPPLYVSTVDSGNLAGLILTLRVGLKELPDQPVVATQLARGMLDACEILFTYFKQPNDPAAAAFHEVLREPLTGLKSLYHELATQSPHEDFANKREIWTRILDATRRLKELSQTFSKAEDEEVRWWVQSLIKQCEQGIERSLALFAPWLLMPEAPLSLWNDTSKSPAAERLGVLKNLIDDLGRMPTMRQVARLGEKVLPLLSEIIETRKDREPERFWLQTLRNGVATSAHNASEQIGAIEKLAQRCEEFSVFEYEFLYDKSRHLLAIGYNVSDHRRDAGFYDLLASEARLCSFVGIAQGYLPQEHWFALGRLLTAWKSEPTLLSWSGSMFEYLMPLLVMPTFRHTLLDQTYRTAVKRQIEYGEQRGVPWGVSESGYNTTDVHLNYQYRAFGVPGLGFKRGLADDVVIAPYASVMAVMVAPEESCKNMRRLSSLEFEGRYGFYEAIDYTPNRLASGQTCAPLRSFMAHHQGMSFLALAYHLLDQRMQRRFSSDPFFQATELLLHERVPKAVAFYPHAPEVSAAGPVSGENETALRLVATSNTSRPEAHLLSNGRYTVMITNAGGGYSRWKNLAVTRWREDPTCDNWGTFCYVRDVGTGALWSAAHQPTLAAAPHYEAIFPQARAEFRRRDHDLEMHTEVTVSPEDDIELRRFSLTNLSSRKRVIELTSYAEVVLAPQAADEAHPAFSNLFVQTEIMREKQAILCTRRPRSAQEAKPVMFHLMTVHGPMQGEASYETDRNAFLGRGRSPASPAGILGTGGQSVLGGREGSVLDPIVAIRCQVEIEPEQTLRIHVVTGISESRENALELVEKYHDRHIADRVFELAWTHRQVVLRQLNISEADANLYARLASAVIYANPLRRATPSILAKNRLGQSGLWGYGISGDLPIVLLRTSDQEKISIVRQLIQAHGYWRMMGLSVDLVICNEDDSGYRQNLNDQILSLIAAGTDPHYVDRPGGIFVRRAEQMSEEDRVLLQTVARAVIVDSGGTLTDQIERRGRSYPAVPAFAATRSLERDALEVDAQETVLEDLKFANGLGGFAEDGREYVIRTTPQSLTPAPWSNVIANRFFGTVVSESGSAYTWCENAHEFRLTPWYNDALSDTSGEAFYLRDDETGEFWSPTPLPARGPEPYATRHGFGYSMFSTSHTGITSELTMYVAIDAPVKLNVLTVRNTSKRTRTLSATGYCEWVLGELRPKSSMHVTTECDPATSALFARNPYHAEFGSRIAFFHVSEPVRTFTCDRSEFIGRNGRLASPATMLRAHLSGRAGAALDPCSALQVVMELEPGEERELVFVLGVGRDGDDARTLIRRFTGKELARHALQEAKAYWQRTLGAVQITTPDPSVNVLANGWLIYQTLASRIWGRSGYYQSGGAFGFRDQLQDAMSLLHCQPALLREQLLRCAGRQFRDGDVQHWWHPPSGRGVRTHFSDDFLWLPLAASRYVLAVRDTGVLDERVDFIEGRQVKPDEEAYLDLPVRSEESATLYQHCVRALNRGHRYGQHGLPLIGCGDWNDGMNLVGEHGKGESVWLAFFQIEVLNRFAQVAALYGDADFAIECKRRAGDLRMNIEKHGWDGKWYLRAFFDNGQPLGSSTNAECQIDSLPQSWAVLSGAGDPERSRTAMAAVAERLVDRKNRLVKLFDPPFDKSTLNPGYIKGYVPGVRENGGQYTHAAIWVAMAFAASGDHERAWEIFNLINPLNLAGTPAAMAVYKGEPYVMSADVYAVQPHTGRAGWSWYTGAAGWMYRLILESLLGIRLDNGRLFFAPCVPPEWKEFQVRYQYRNTTYEISASATSEAGLKGRLTLDGREIAERALVLVDDEKVHGVQVLF